MARFTLKQFFIAIVVGAILSLAIARGVRGDPVGLVVITTLATMAGTLLLFSVGAAFLWCWGMLVRARAVPTPTSPFATDRTPDQLIPPSDPDAS